MPDNDYLMKVTNAILNRDWIDHEFNDKIGLRYPTGEERELLNEHVGKDTVIGSLQNGKGRIERARLNQVEENGLHHGSKYIPYAGAQRTGIVAVFSDDLELIYSVAKIEASS